MGRRRTVSDSAVLEAALRVIGRSGPEGFTLAAVAAECGLAAATLVQRYGSKRGLQLALAQAAAEGGAACLDAVRQAHRSPLAALMAAFDMLAGMAATPESLANSLAYLQMDLADAELRHWTRRQSEATLKGYERLIRDAIAAGELDASCDARGLARLIQAAAHGSLVSWAFLQQEGDARTWLRRDMRLLLKPYRR